MVLATVEHLKLLKITQRCQKSPNTLLKSNKFTSYNLVYEILLQHSSIRQTQITTIKHERRIESEIEFQRFF